MKEDNNRKHKRDLYFLIIWNIFIFLGLSIFLFYSLLNKKVDFSDIREYIFLVLIGFILLISLITIIKKIKLLKVFSNKSDNIIKTPEKEIYTYKFLKIYKKLVYRRMLVIFAPILFSFVIAIFLYIATSKIQNRNEEIVSLIYMGGKITFFITLLPCLVIFLIIYISSSQKIRMLQKVYDFASKKEVNDLDEIESLTELHSPKPKYIFTRKFFINWDGSLNIFILEDIEKVEYKKYNYFFIYGTKLLIHLKNGKRKNICYAGPDENEWRKRNFIVKKNSNFEGKVDYNINLPI